MDMTAVFQAANGLSRTRVGLKLFYRKETSHYLEVFKSD